MSRAANDPGQPLSAREAYRLWAPSYDAESALTAMEEQGIRRFAPDPHAGRLLDAGCGTARRLAARPVSGTTTDVGVDLVPEMLVDGRMRHPGRFELVAGDIARLPFRSRAFDLVWCRLVLGHVPSLIAPYAELARVCTAAGSLIISDFHPRAADAGFSRTFRDMHGDLHAVEHHRHEIADHASAAARAGLDLEHSHEVVVDSTVRDYYEKAGLARRYREQFGHAMVLLLHFTPHDGPASHEPPAAGSRAAP